MSPAVSDDDDDDNVRDTASATDVAAVSSYGAAIPAGRAVHCSRHTSKRLEQTKIL